MELFLVHTIATPHHTIGIPCIHRNVIKICWISWEQKKNRINVLKLRTIGIIWRCQWEYVRARLDTHCKLWVPIFHLFFSPEFKLFGSKKQKNKHLVKFFFSLLFSYSILILLFICGLKSKSILLIVLKWK